jgi:hypothetical protein
MNEITQFLMMAAAGSLVQECFHWYDLRGKLGPERYQALIQSRLYKAIVVGMVVMSPLTSWLLFSQKLGGDQMQDVQSIMGAACPLIARKIVSALTKNLHLRFSTTFAVVNDYLS